MTHKVYVCTIDVRGYEMDSYGHVNNAVYLNYFEHARWQLLAEEGMTLDTFNGWKRWPVVAGVEVQYLRPVKMGEKLTIKTQVVETRKTSCTFEHTIEREGEVVTRAKVHGVFINEAGKAASPPDKVREIWGAIK